MMISAVAAIVLAPPLLLRQAQVDISPPEPLPLGGYTERHGKVMEPGGEPLYARCLDFEQGSTKVALISVEMLTVPESLHREVTARLPKGIKLFLQATHTHCAPDSQMLNDRMTFSIPGIASYRKRWLTWYADKIASAYTEAAKQKAVELTALSATTAIVAANRTRRPGGKPDPTLTALFYDYEGPSPFSAGPRSRLLTHFAAHPTIYGPDRLQTTGDWPGILAKDTGSLVLNGAIGDVSPVADGPTIEAKLQDFHKRVSATDKSVTFPVWSRSPKGDRSLGRVLSWTEQAIRLDPKQPHPTFAKTNGIPEGLAKTLTDQFAPPSAKIVAMRLGRLAIVGVPGEPTSILGNEIKAAAERMGFRSVLVCSHVNGWIGYILDPEDYDHGDYEATLSFYGRQEGPKVVDAAIRALKRLR